MFGNSLETNSTTDEGSAARSKPIVVAAMFVGMAAIFGIKVLVTRLHDRMIASHLHVMIQPHYWGPTGGSYGNELIVMGAVIVVLGILVSRQGLSLKLATLGLFLWGYALLEWTNQQSYFTIAGTQVTVFSAAPWRQPIAFDLKSADIVKRGCYHFGGSHHRDIATFVVRDPTTGTEVNIGNGFNAYGAEDWLRIMQPYLDGSIALGDGVDIERDPMCLSAKGQLLDETKRAQLRQLLETADFPRMPW